MLTKTPSDKATATRWNLNLPLNVNANAIVENASGLGLAISKQIIEAHGGTISTTESQLRGAAFKIEF